MNIMNRNEVVSEIVFVENINEGILCEPPCPDWHCSCEDDYRCDCDDTSCNDTCDIPVCDDTN